MLFNRSEEYKFSAFFLGEGEDYGGKAPPEIEHYLNY
jgi:hypothetical protein